jgi:hypothetical protein
MSWYRIRDAWDDLVYAIEGAWKAIRRWEWWSPLLCFLLSIAIALTVTAVLSSYDVAKRQEQVQGQIELCLRAFEYTREQCEFIVRNGSLPR